MRAVILAFPLLLSGADHAAEPAPHGVGVADAEYEKLVVEYDKAVAAHKQAFEDADLSQRRELRKQHPATLLWERFQALGDGGEGRAYLWLIEHARDRGMKRAEAMKLKAALYEKVFTDHVRDPWLTDALTLLMNDSLNMDERVVEGYLRKTEDQSPVPEVKALSLMRLGELLSFSDDADRKAEGEAILEDYEARFIGAGAQALDFSGMTIDGHPFKLSDYQGKAVLVDFYGFW